MPFDASFSPPAPVVDLEIEVDGTTAKWPGLLDTGASTSILPRKALAEDAEPEGLMAVTFVGERRVLSAFRMTVRLLGGSVSLLAAAADDRSLREIVGFDPTFAVCWPGHSQRYRFVFDGPDEVKPVP